MLHLFWVNPPFSQSLYQSLIALLLLFPQSSLLFQLAERFLSPLALLLSPLALLLAQLIEFHRRQEPLIVRAINLQSVFFEYKPYLQARTDPTVDLFNLF